MSFNWKHMDIRYINLDHREDRRRHMERELRRVDLLRHSKVAPRFPAMRPDDWDGPPQEVAEMAARHRNVIGTYLSERALIREAVERKRSVVILQDDVVLADDIIRRLQFIATRLPKVTDQWDIFWLGGTFHVNPPVWHKDTIGRDVETTREPRILRTYGIWSTYAWIVNHESAAKVLEVFGRRIHESYGDDHLAILCQPELLTYCFVPGCAWQYDDRSDITGELHEFSQHAKLGPYTWQKEMDDFDPSEFDWAEAKR